MQLRLLFGFLSASVAGPLRHSFSEASK